MKKRKLLSIMLILSLFIGMVGIVNAEPSYAASKKIHVKKKTVSLQVGKKYQQKLIAKNGKTIKAKKVNWKSKKPSVAKINKKGKITAVRPGTAKMTAKYKGKTYKFTVKVQFPTPATPKVSANKTNITFNTLDPIVVNVTNTSEWTISDCPFNYSQVNSVPVYSVIKDVKKSNHEFELTLVPLSNGKQNLRVYDDIGSAYCDINITVDIKPTPNQCNLKVGETAVVYAPSGCTISSWYGDNYIVTDNVEDQSSIRITGKSPGSLTIPVYISQKSNVTDKYGFSYGFAMDYQLKITITEGKDEEEDVLTRDEAEKKLHLYIIENGKQVPGTGTIIGDYYIESSSTATSSKNRIVMSAYVDNPTIIMYSIASDGTDYDLFHNQPDVPEWRDDFMYSTTEKDNSIYHFPINYWGKIIVADYSGKLYGEENGITECEKSGPTEVTDTTELYKTYRKTRDAMKEFNDFLNSKVGFGLKSLGYESYN